ncbi:MAG: hypothetical protein KDM64_13625, partial [Verrucomicrobiae bacterium]|nr:hypothetical protein [Verrucomicrobiae bacterium]
PFHVRAMVLADKTLFAAGPYGDAIRSIDSFEGKRGVRLAAASATDGKLLASYAIDAMPVFDGLAAANGRLFLAMKDGTVRCFGESGAPLKSTLGEPIEVLPEELLPSDEEYKKEMREFLGQPEPSKGGAAAGGPRKELKGQSRSGDFAKVAHGKVVKSPIGYRIGADAKEFAVALNELEKPVTERATWTFQMQAAKGFDQPQYYRNGFFVFGDGADSESLVACGIQFIQGIAVLFEGTPNGKSLAKGELSGDLNRVFDVEVSVDLAQQTVTLKAGSQTVTGPLKRRLAAVSHVGFGAWNAVTDFGSLERRD